MPRRTFKKISPSLLIVIASVVCIIIAAILLVKIFISRYPYFIVKKVVMVGVDNSYSGIVKHFIGENIFSLDLRAAKLEIERSSPDVECLSIGRRFPSQLFIFFRRRNAIFQVKLGRFYLVDPMGVITGKPQDIAYEDLVVVSGLESKMLSPKAGKSYGFPELTLSSGLIREKNNTPELSEYKLIKINFGAHGEPSFFIVENSKIGEPVVKLNSKPKVQVEVRFNLSDPPDEVLKVLALLIGKQTTASRPVGPAIDKGKSFENIEYIDLKNLKSPAVLEKKEKVK